MLKESTFYTKFTFPNNKCSIEMCEVIKKREEEEEKGNERENSSGYRAKRVY